MSTSVDEAEAVPSDLISISAAARVLVVHQTTVYRIIREGKLRAWKAIGSRVRVSRAEVVELLVPVQVYAASEGCGLAVEDADDRAAEAALARLRAKGVKA